MRAILLALLVAVPLVGTLPTAHACSTLAPLAMAGDVYLTSPTQSPKGPLRVRSGATDVGTPIPDCLWWGTGIEVWQESNGIAGLQTSGGSGCAADTLVLGGQAAVTTRCVL